MLALGELIARKAGYGGSSGCAAPVGRVPRGPRSAAPWVEQAVRVGSPQPLARGAAPLNDRTHPSQPDGAARSPTRSGSRSRGSGVGTHRPRAARRSSAGPAAPACERGDEPVDVVGRAAEPEARAHRAVGRRSRASSGWAQNRPSRTPMPCSADRYGGDARRGRRPSTVNARRRPRSGLSGQTAAASARPASCASPARSRSRSAPSCAGSAPAVRASSARQAAASAAAPSTFGVPASCRAGAGRPRRVDGLAARRSRTAPPPAEVRRRGVEPVAAADEHAGAERGVELVPGEREVVDAEAARSIRRCGASCAASTATRAPSGGRARRSRAAAAPRR